MFIMNLWLIRKRWGNGRWHLQHPWAECQYVGDLRALEDATLDLGPDEWIHRAKILTKDSSLWAGNTLPLRERTCP